MRRLVAVAGIAALVAASCGGGDDDAGTSDDAASTAADDTEQSDAATATTAAEQPDPEPTTPPETTTAPETTAAPETTTNTTEPPPPPIEVVGLVPLPGATLDFSAQPMEDPSLVWSLYSGSGGVIVENMGRALPPGCHGTSFFDPETFELLQISESDAHVYATRGDGGCGNMQQDLPPGVVDGAPVALNEDDLILFDFGELPAAPFDVSTQVLDPDGTDGVFRSADFEDPIVANDLSGATHVVGASGLFEVDDTTGLLSRLPQPPFAAGTGCDEFLLCLGERFQIDIVNAEGSPGSVQFATGDAGRFFFFSPETPDALVRIVNGCEINNTFWVFAASSTSVEYALTITDTSSGESSSYDHTSALEPVLDTEAFATCP